MEGSSRSSSSPIKNLKAKADTREEAKAWVPTVTETLADKVHIEEAVGGSPKATSDGISNGIVPMLRVFNDTVRYVDQGGGKRKGAFVVYLDPWHADIFDFLDLRKIMGRFQHLCACGEKQLFRRQNQSLRYRVFAVAPRPSLKPVSFGKPVGDGRSISTQDAEH